MPAIKVPIERLRKRIASFRCSAAEYQQLENAASRADIPLSDWLRSTTLAIASDDRWPAPGTVLKVGEDGELTCAGSREVVNPAVMAEVAIAATPEEDILKAYIGPAVEAVSRRMEADVSNLHAQFVGSIAEPATELPLTWADHWALMERMEPGEATERLYELAAGRKFPDGFARWSKERKIEWLEETWPL